MTREAEVTVIIQSQKRMNGSKKKMLKFFHFLILLYTFFSRILIEEYLLLFKSSRTETLKAINESHQIEIAESVKLKILFSVVVVSIVDLTSRYSLCFDL